MRYEMEELAPIVGKLAEKYTSKESTSITYEKAEQLMGAVLYCIREAMQQEGSLPVTAKGISAKQAYETGAAYVEEKTKKALELYNELMLNFSDYGNHCLHDTVVDGITEFFKWYDIRFEPQNTIITLDYPILKDISEYTGIDKIFEYIRCISLEQKFLNAFPKEYILRILSTYNKQYRDMIENLCEVVLMEAAAHMPMGKPLSNPDLSEYLKNAKEYCQIIIEG